MAAPLLQAPGSLISNVSRMPQCRWMKPLGPVRPGTRTININRRAEQNQGGRERLSPLGFGGSNDVEDTVIVGVVRR
jgi:hypothetical protein